MSSSGSSSMRLRQGGQPTNGSRRRAADGRAEKASSSRKLSNSSSLPDSHVIIYLLLLCLLTGLALRSYWTLPQNVAPGDPNSFNSQDARKHLEDIVALGIRHVGSEANEIHTVNLLVQKVEEIRRLASRQVEIELSLQQTSGSFFINFPDAMTHLYHNISNVVVKFKRRGSNPEHALLLNAHYDSALGSPAASDDAVSCATMLEILQSISSDPKPFLPDHSVIFLFNGAEETILQASHGFVKQHPWAREVRAFLNLEAAGAGGKEIVFQTGPDHPWLARTYANVVPHPFGSVVAQEVFQSGIIPSDTDFRIFRDYGHIPGIDMAYFVNGYIYHTEYDTADRIPDGSIQRAGENVLSLVRELAMSPLLEDPGSDKQGKVVFFDILGLFSVVYPERIAVIINSLVVLAGMASLYSGVSLKRHRLDKPSLGMVLKAVAVTILSWVAAIAVNILTALLLDVTGHSMSWFTHTYLLLPLYTIPALLAMAEVHSFWQKMTPAVKVHLCEQSSLQAITLVYTTLLALLTYLRVCSAFFFASWLLFSLVFRRLVWDGILHRWLAQNAPNSLRHTLFVVCEALSISLPFMFGILLVVSLIDFFLPLMGRSGSHLPPDLALGVVVAVLVCIICTMVVPFVVHTASKRLRMVMAGGLALLYVTGMIIALSGSAFPFAGGENPSPKRLYLQHINRQFLNKDGSTRLADSRIAIATLDYTELDPVAEAVPEFMHAQEWDCNGPFCGVPYYVPLMKHIKRCWYLPAPPLSGMPSVRLEVVSVQETTTGRRNFTFYMNIPPRASIFIAPRGGQILTSWSLEEFVPPSLPCNFQKPQGEQCHFIFYSRGLGGGGETFWLELEGSPKEGQEVIEIVVATQHLDPPLSLTPTLSSLLSSLPAWVTPVAWTVTYTSWTF